MLDVGAILSEAGDSPPCGPNLEHDLSFFELEEAARGKPEQRSGTFVKPAEDPNWPRVVDLAQVVLGRSKDLRIAVLLTRGLAHTEGISGLAAGLGLLHGLLDRYWDGIHPVLEHDRDDDPTERLNALAPLVDHEGVIKDLRDTYLVNAREHGQLQVRDVEIALGRLPGRAPGAASKPLPQVHAQMAAAFSSDHSVPSALREAHEHLTAIQALLAERVGAARAIDFKPLIQPLQAVLAACDTALGTQPVGGERAIARESGVVRATVQEVPGEIHTREDALRMLDLVCSYLEAHEPSNPAPLFIRRAQRLIKKNFVEIVQDLMPDSLSQLERLAGEIPKASSD
jgi:type VI secretion system protein ImpA